MQQIPRVHELKTWPAPFSSVWDGSKKYEIRVDDRGYAVGDFLRLREYDPRGSSYRGRFSDRAVLARVTYMTPGGQWGLPANVCVLSIDVVGRLTEYKVGAFDALAFVCANPECAE